MFRDVELALRKINDEMSDKYKMYIDLLAAARLLENHIEKCATEIGDAELLERLMKYEEVSNELKHLRTKAHYGEGVTRDEQALIESLGLYKQVLDKQFTEELYSDEP